MSAGAFMNKKGTYSGSIVKIFPPGSPQRAGAESAATVGGVSFLLSIVRGAPEARRFESRTLRFFGDNSYCLYLVHLPLLALAHGLLLGAAPDLQTPWQWAVTLATLPVCVLAGWGLTKLIEEPLMVYGRRWRWSAERRGGGAIAGASVAR
jgi:peptidoglycan/LPS O-acetylase OafA/YrhL